MRIVEVISGLGLGGAEQALNRRLEFAPRDVETYVVVTGRQDSHLVEAIHQKATIVRDASKVTQLVPDLHPDLILTHNPREALRILSHPRLSMNFPVVVVAHNEITSEYKAKAKFLDMTLPKVNNRARMHIAVSSRAATGPQCANGRDVRICLLGGSLNISCRPARESWPPDSRHRVLVLGRLSPQKNLVALLDAVRILQDGLRRSGTHLVIAGDGELKTTLENQLVRLQITDLVSFLGWIPDPGNLIMGADTLFIPSVSEGGPLTLYEALLAGTRVVSTPVGAVADLLQGHFGLEILDGHSTLDLAQGLSLISSSVPITVDERTHRRRLFRGLDVRVTSNQFYSLCRSVAP